MGNAIKQDLKETIKMLIIHGNEKNACENVGDLRERKLRRASTCDFGADVTNPKTTDIYYY